MKGATVTTIILYLEISKVSHHMPSLAPRGGGARAARGDVLNFNLHLVNIHARYCRNSLLYIAPMMGTIVLYVSKRHATSLVRQTATWIAYLYVNKNISINTC